MTEKDPDVYFKVFDIIKNAYETGLKQYQKYKHAKPNMVGKVMEEIVSEMPLKEKVVIANSKKENMGTVEYILYQYIQTKTGLGPEDGDSYSIYEKAILKKLKREYKLRVVK